MEKRLVRDAVIPRHAMIEVFKTNISDDVRARYLIDRIHDTFSGLRANFDLEDRDRILRVQCEKGAIQPLMLIDWLKDLDCQAEVLQDDQA